MSIVIKKRIPVNIISGPLGVGKTTTINHLLSQRPDNEKWAVLVNEYGLIGLDAAFIKGATASKNEPGVDIKEVAGGCICCSAGFMFNVSLVLLLQKRPDRLLIEPTGLAALSGILDTLDKPGIRESVDIRSVVCLLDPSHFEKSLGRKEAIDQVEAADVLIASRSDISTSQATEKFLSWANSIFPPKRLVSKVSHGALPLSVLDLVRERPESRSKAGHIHGTDHQHDSHAHHNHEREDQDTPSGDHPIEERVHLSSEASTVGWLCSSELTFDADLIELWLRKVSMMSSTLRVKAAVKTNEGWVGFNFVGTVQTVGGTGYRRESRLEIIFEGDDFPQVEHLRKDLEGCIISNQNDN